MPVPLGRFLRLGDSIHLFSLWIQKICKTIKINSVTNTKIIAIFWLKIDDKIKYMNISNTRNQNVLQRISCNLNNRLILNIDY